MKRTSSVLMVSMMLGSFSNAMAATSADVEGMSFWTLLFIGFFALIIVMQLIPGLSLLVSMLAGIFSTDKNKTEKVASVRSGEN